MSNKQEISMEKATFYFTSNAFAETATLT